jgi:hypothetical protein
MCMCVFVPWCEANQGPQAVIQEENGCLVHVQQQPRSHIVVLVRVAVLACGLCLAAPDGRKRHKADAPAPAQLGHPPVRCA